MSKHYFIAKKNAENKGSDSDSLVHFSMFMLLCAVTWLVLKFAFRFSGFVLGGFILWFVVKKLFGNTKENDAPAKLLNIVKLRNET
jgi:multisubunit Na+/H+ antiporter MnhE subunit